MFGWRTLASLAAMLIGAGSARAQSYSLVEGPLPDSYFRVEIDMALSGEIKVVQEGKTVTLKQSAKAHHQFVERALVASSSGLVDKSARIYQSAQAEIVVDKDTSERTLREERRLLVAQRIKDQVVSYCPKGSLTREELGLTEHLDTLALPGLLPTNEVKVGAGWKVANAPIQGLCDLDGLIAQDISCKLDKVDGDLAQVSLAGTVTGINQGAAVKIAIAGSYQFDLKEKRLLSLEWKQNDRREQGPVSPSFAAEVVTKLKRTPIEAVTELNDFVLALVPHGPTPPEHMTQIYYSDPQGRFELLHARDWHLVGRSERQTIMRLMEHGDFVAQLTVTPWKKAEPGKHTPEDEFKESVSQAPGWEPDEALDKGTKVEDSKDNYWVYRVGASGTLNSVKAVQYFYLVAGPQGEQIVLTFTMSPAQAQKLNTRDLALVRNLTFTGSKEAAVTPAPP